MSSRTRWIILALSVVGFGFATASTWVHYRVLTDPAYVSPCDVSAAFNCTQVYLSRYGSVAGVPVAIAGMFWFALTLLIAAFAKPTNGPSSAIGYLRVLSVVGLATVLYLGYASFFVLGTGCLLCIGTYVAVLGIFLAAFAGRAVPLGDLPEHLSRDLGGLSANPTALVAALALVVGTIGAAIAFPSEEQALAGRSAAVSSASGPSDDIRQQFAAAWNQLPRTELGVDPQGAKVVIVKFNDFQCPACRQWEFIYKPILGKFEASHPGAVRYVVKDFPLDTACNFHTSSTIRGHEAACDASGAARMAKDRGKYEEMVEWIYANQGVSQADLRAATQRILGVTDFDREYAQKLPDIRRDIADGGVLNINTTPTYFINGVRMPSNVQPAQIEMAILLEIEKGS